MNPDFAFAEIDLHGLPCLDISAEANVIEVGSEIVTLGFPMGEKYLSPYSTDAVSQITPFARHGIISSVLPCACKHPHGFSIDVLSESGASDSPIFLAEEGTVIGILHAGFDHAPVTYGVPGWILKQGLDSVRRDWQPQAKPTLNDVVEAERSMKPKPLEWDKNCKGPVPARHANVEKIPSRRPTQTNGRGKGAHTRSMSRAALPPQIVQ